MKPAQPITLTVTDGGISLRQDAVSKLDIYVPRYERLRAQWQKELGQDVAPLIARAHQELYGLPPLQGEVPLIARLAYPDRYGEPIPESSLSALYCAAFEYTLRMCRESIRLIDAGAAYDHALGSLMQRLSQLGALVIELDAISRERSASRAANGQPDRSTENREKVADDAHSGATLNEIGGLDHLEPRDYWREREALRESLPKPEPISKDEAERWRRKDLWRLREAAWLLCGYRPFESSDWLEEVQQWFRCSKQFGELRVAEDALERAVAAGYLRKFDFHGLAVRPEEVIAWADSTRFPRFPYRNAEALAKALREAAQRMQQTIDELDEKEAARRGTAGRAIPGISARTPASEKPIVYGNTFTDGQPEPLRAPPREKARRHVLDRAIDKAVALAGGEDDSAAVWLQLKELALAGERPFTGGLDGGALVYTDGNNKIKRLTRDALTKRLNRRLATKRR